MPRRRAKACSVREQSVQLSEPRLSGNVSRILRDVELGDEEDETLCINTSPADRSTWAVVFLGACFHQACCASHLCV